MTVTDLDLLHQDTIAPCAVFDVRPGWVPLIRQAAVAASGFPPAEKVSIMGCVASGGMLILKFSKPTSLKFAGALKLRESIRKKSLATCEECGKPARLRIGHARQMTTCEDHVHLVGELRDDDGRHLDPWEMT
ncbi:hypothetical protein FY136_28710 (plasmid) [Agrobacterium tumefaciens]|uniref:hypothetical protein n=1 Tax=Agrobacterium tumefaciens TaxID=358 RepID=UPI0021CFB743|nr:hypothetical protein [Agrobacterium tumefaciens]UXT53245.1 hypothetical protein FY136_28710 [Agrobacterium tumefaciens]